MLVVGAGMFAFWPQKAEKFNTHVPNQQEEKLDFKQQINIQPIKVYGTGTVKKPVSVFVDDKNIYTADVGTNNIKIYTRENKTVAVIKGTGSKQKDPLNFPNGITGLTDDKLLVTDSGAKKLILYKRDSAYIKVIEVTGGKILKPGTAVAYGTDIYIADLEAHDIKVIDDSGKITKTIATPINKHLVLKYPQGMAFDNDGNLWVADGGNERVVAFDIDGRLFKSFRGVETGGNPFYMVKGIAVMQGKYLAVSDPMANRVRIFDISSNLKEVAQIGGFGKSQGKLIYPMGLIVDKNQHLFVADRGNSRIQEYAIK